MGDRIVIAIYDNGRYIISLYDHWGGRVLFLRDEEINPNIVESIHILRDNSNDVGNFLSMFVHWWRDMRGFDPDDGYTIYLETIPAVPEYPVVVYDYSKDSFKKISYEELLDDIKETFFNICDEFRDSSKH